MVALRSRAFWPCRLPCSIVAQSGGSWFRLPGGGPGGLRRSCSVGAAVRCTQCGTEYAPGARYCSQCAAPLSTAPPAHLVGAAPEPVHADLRVVTVLFADISGFTSLSEKLHPEAVRDLITACFDRLVPCIERYGGAIDKFIGDEVMALFGAPVAHENDPERALRAALEMLNALAGFNLQLDVNLGIHFGVNTGLVYAGGVGGGSRQDYSVMGDVVNVAARLKGAAKNDEILVGAATYRQAEPLFNFQTAEALSLKGKAEPVPVYRLMSARAAPTTTRASRGLNSPLIGREEELGAFWRSLERFGPRRGRRPHGDRGGRTREIASGRRSPGPDPRRRPLLAGRPHPFLRTHD